MPFDAPVTTATLSFKLLIGAPPGRRSSAQHGTAPTWNEGHAALASRQMALRMNRVQSAGQPVVASPGPPVLQPWRAQARFLSAKKPLRVRAAFPPSASPY